MADIAATSGGREPRDLAHELLDAVDPDRVLDTARDAGLDDPTAEQLDAIRQERMMAATAPFNDPDLRELLTGIQACTEQVIHTQVKDRLLGAGYSADATERARQTVADFEQFLEENADEITALQLLFNQPYRKRDLTLQAIEELKQRIEQPPHTWTTASLWEA